MARSIMRPLSLRVLLIAAAAVSARAQFVVTETYDANATNPFVSADVLPGVPGDQVTIRSAIERINTLPPGTYTVEARHPTLGHERREVVVPPSGAASVELHLAVR